MNARIKDHYIILYVINKLLQILCIKLVFYIIYVQMVVFTPNSNLDKYPNVFICLRN